MHTLQLTYKNHKGAKAIYLEDGAGNHFIVCPLELSEFLGDSSKDASLNLCQISYEGNIMEGTAMDIHQEGSMFILTIRNNTEMMSRQYVLPCQQFLTMVQTSLQVLALTKSGIRRSENGLALAI